MMSTTVVKSAEWAVCLTYYVVIVFNYLSNRCDHASLVGELVECFQF